MEQSRADGVLEYCMEIWDLRAFVAVVEDGAAWYDELTAVLRSHGIDPGPAASYDQDLLPDVKLAAVSAGGKFALAPAGRLEPLPDSVRWLALAGRPLVRRTWVAWPAASPRRDLAYLVAALEDALAGTVPAGDDG